VISCRTLEWSREFEWSCDRDDEGVIALCWGDEDGRCAGRLRGLMELDEGYIFDMNEIPQEPRLIICRPFKET
jgi:hypothetical protein